MKSLDINAQFQKAVDIIESTTRNLLIFGKAGTGKSTFLNFFREQTKKNVVVLAPTGVAAINVSGMTIHSFFGFSIDLTLDKVKKLSQNHRARKILKTLDTIIIDEISMVRADLLDCVDKFLKLNGLKPALIFGGIQMVFIGDLYQIPPIVTNDIADHFKNYYSSPYFFSAKIFLEAKNSFEFIEFEKVYRQNDADFIAILNAIRNNTTTSAHLELLNQRYQPTFQPTKNDFWVHITGTNQAVKNINDAMLHKLNSEEKVFFGEVDGEIKKDSFPTDLELKVKTGAQVMLVNNDADYRWVNGTIGHITAIKHGQERNAEVIELKLANGDFVDVVPHTWDVFKYEVEESNHTLKTVNVGSFTQYPLRLAWALTVHKSQGKTFDNVIIDLATTFTPGQMYVALSRCTKLNGLILKKKVSSRNIFIDYRVVKFLTEFQYQKSAAILPLNTKIDLIKDAITNKKLLEIVYLKARDEKSQRIVKPTYIGDMIYQDKKFIGMTGVCKLRGEERNFRVDRILDIKIV